MDFMIDEGLKPWLIEINTNPCLELSSPLLMKIIPELIEQTFRYHEAYAGFAWILSSLRLRSGQAARKCLLVIVCWTKITLS